MWPFKDGTPIYLQITEEMKLRILRGVYPAGAQVPPVRELAMEAGVNPNTVQRALADLERDGLVFSQRTAGRFVTGDVSMIENAKLRLADQCVENFLSEMAKLGCGRDEVIALLQDRKEEES